MKIGSTLRVNQECADDDVSGLGPMERMIVIFVGKWNALRGNILVGKEKTRKP